MKNIRIYYEKQEASDSIKRDAKGRYTLIENSNDTEVLLFHSYMIRNADMGFAPNSERYIYSTLRFGNAIIMIYERTTYDELYNNQSSKFIAILCDSLKLK